MLQDFLIPFVAIGLSELGDKTQLAVFCLASKTKKHFLLLIGVILAFVVTDGLAILLGGAVTNVIPQTYLKIFASAMFIIFGIFTLISRNKHEAKCDLRHPFMTGFGMIAVSEMGDKSQISAALFATQFNPILVFIGVISALAILSLLAVYLGSFITKKVNKRTISLFAGGLFILIGIYIISGLF